MTRMKKEHDSSMPKLSTDDGHANPTFELGSECDQTDSKFQSQKNSQFTFLLIQCYSV